MLQDIAITDAHGDYFPHACIQIHYLKAKEVKETSQETCSTLLPNGEWEESAEQSESITKITNVTIKARYWSSLALFESGALARTLVRKTATGSSDSFSIEFDDDDLADWANYNDTATPTQRLSDICEKRLKNEIVHTLRG